MGDLYRTVLEAFDALREMVPDDHRDAGLRREVQGTSVLTAAFNIYGPSYPFHRLSVPSDAKIHMMRQVITQTAIFPPLFRHPHRRNHRRRIEMEEKRLYEKIEEYAAVIRDDTSRTAHISNWDLYSISLRIAVTAVPQDRSAFHIGLLTDETLHQAYADNAMMQGGRYEVSNRALLLEYTVLERVLRRVHDEVCKR